MSATLPSGPSAPDFLLFGSPDATAAFHAALGSAVRLATFACDVSAPDSQLYDRAIRAVAGYNARALVLADAELAPRLGESLRAALPVPVHGAGAPLAEALRLTCTRHVALIATPALLSNPTQARTHALLMQRGLRITPIDASTLDYIAQRRAAGLAPDIMALREFLAPIHADARIDTAVLATPAASTLRSQLERAAIRPFYWLDAARVAAQKIMLLQEDNQQKDAG